MKAGFFIWIDYEKRMIRRSKRYEMIEEFDARNGDRPYPHKWNEEIFETQSLQEAIKIQKRLVVNLTTKAEKMRDKIKGAHTHLTERESPLSLYEHCRIEGGFKEYEKQKIEEYMNRHYGLR